MNKYLLLALLVIAGCKRPAAQETKNISVSGVVYQTEAYCGGAAPTQRMLDELQRPKALAGKNLYFKAGKENDPDAPVVAEATSNDSGGFSVSLAPGWYVIVDENKKDKASYNYMVANFETQTAQYSAIDKKCLDSWVVKPELVFEVTEGAGEPVNVTFHKPCSWNSFPCVKFIGERPR